MKNRIKNFSTFVNESRDNVAIVDLSTGMGGEFAVISFQGEEAYVDEKKSLRATWKHILDIARAMGADAIYSTEDDEIITDEIIDSLSDEPSGWSDED
jgi:hypothetical protein